MPSPALNPTTTNEPEVHSSEAPALGFTAVNGESRNLSITRVDGPSRKALSDQDYRDSTEVDTEISHSPVQYHCHGWRADSHSSYPPRRDSLETRKRKRSDSICTNVPREVQGHQPNDDRTGSPRRRMTNMDSAIDLSSPDKASQVPPTFPAIERRAAEPAPIGPYSRYDAISRDFSDAADEVQTTLACT